jgi:hypothetical protein
MIDRMAHHRRLRRLAAFGLVLATQLLAGVEPHTGHSLSASLREEIEGFRIQPAACHPQLAAHCEAAACESNVEPCTACLVALQSTGLARPRPPALHPPEILLPCALPAALPHRQSASSSPGPRAPPLLA